MPTVWSVGAWKISSALRSSRDALEQALLGDVVEEFAAHAERPAGERDLDFARGADLVEHDRGNRPVDVVRIGGRRDRHHGACFRHLGGGGQHGRAAEAVADQDRGRTVGPAQVLGGSDQVGDIGGEGACWRTRPRSCRGR